MLLIEVSAEAIEVVDGQDDARDLKGREEPADLRERLDNGEGRVGVLGV